MVIRGFKDRKEYELKETYAPVSRLPVIRSCLAIINKYDLDVCQMDVKTAFFNGILEDDIFMEIPDGLNVDDNERKSRVCKLIRSIYGSKISPKRWNKRFSEEALKLGLENDLHEPCLFTWRKDGKMALLALYVDDMLLASNDKNKLEKITSKLSQVFQMKDVGEPKNFLGMNIHRDRENKVMDTSQKDYIEKILEKFNMKECKAQSTPMVTRQVKNRELRNTKSNVTQYKTEALYREATGSLLYLAGATRPDISFAVNYLSRMQINATEDDWIEVKRIFRYLRGTTDLGIIYRGKSESLEAMTDSSFRDCEESTSTSGYVIPLFGDPVAWRSHRQQYTSLSTCYAEYLSMSEACQELISLDKATRDILGKTLYPVTIWCDNKAAEKCTQMEGSHKLETFDDSLELIKSNFEFRKRTGTKKHMAETHGDFVKSLVLEGKVIVEYVATEENVADIMTKPLAKDTHIYLKKKLLNLV